MLKQVLIKPLITEKTDALAEDKSKYTFIVDRKANKIEIRKAVEKLYSVAVKSVNTAIIPGKKSVKFTKTGMQKGSTPTYKKAIVTLNEGEEINFYEDI